MISQIELDLLKLTRKDATVLFLVKEIEGANRVVCECYDALSVISDNGKGQGAYAFRSAKKFLEK